VRENVQPQEYAAFIRAYQLKKKLNGIMATFILEEKKQIQKRTVQLTSKIKKLERDEKTLIEQNAKLEECNTLLKERVDLMNVLREEHEKDREQRDADSSDSEPEEDNDPILSDKLSKLRDDDKSRKTSESLSPKKSKKSESAKVRNVKKESETDKINLVKSDKSLEKLVEKVPEKPVDK